MKARLILPPDADRTPEWYAARAHGITATDVPVLMNLVPGSWNSPFSLFHRKVGNVDSDGDNDLLRVGRELEDYVIRRFTENHPELDVNPGGLYASTEDPTRLATPDGLLHERAQCGPHDYGLTMDCTCPNEPVSSLEAKTVQSWDDWGEEGSDDIPINYKAQGLWQADVLGVPETRFAVLNRASGEYREYIVTHDEDELQVMRKEAEAFLDRIDREDPPPLDSAQATTAALRQLHPDLEDEAVELGPQLIQRYRSACAKYKAAEERKHFYENKIRAALGDARTATHGGEKVATRVKSTVKAHWRKQTERDYITPAKTKESK